MNIDVLKEQLNKLFRALDGSFLEFPPQEVVYTIRPVGGKIPKFFVGTDYGSVEAVGLYQTLIKYFEHVTNEAWPNQNIEGEKFLDDAFMQAYLMAMSDGLHGPSFLIIQDLEEQRFRILSWHPNNCTEDCLSTDCDFCYDQAADTSSDCFVTALLDHTKAIQAYNAGFKIAHT